MRLGRDDAVLASFLPWRSAKRWCGVALWLELRKACDVPIWAKRQRRRWRKSRSLSFIQKKQGFDLFWMLSYLDSFTAPANPRPARLKRANYSKFSVNYSKFSVWNIATKYTLYDVILPKVCAIQRKSCCFLWKTVTFMEYSKNFFVIYLLTIANSLSYIFIVIISISCQL